MHKKNLRIFPTRVGVRTHLRHLVSPIVQYIIKCLRAGLHGCRPVDNDCYVVSIDLNVNIGKTLYNNNNNNNNDNNNKNYTYSKSRTYCEKN